MNIAYLFSGHARTWKLCYNNFMENIYRIMPGDIFIHTWDRTNATIGAHWNRWSNHLSVQSAQKIDIKEILESYRPISCMVEKDPGIDSIIKQYQHVHQKNCLGIKNLLHSQKMVFNMSKKYHKYDKYFCTRLDINYLSMLNNNDIYRKEYVVSHSTKHPDNMIFDFWSICSFEQLEIKTQYYNEVDNYWFTKDMIAVPYEMSLYAYLQDHTIPIYRSNLIYNVPRINNSVTSYI